MPKDKPTNNMAVLTTPVLYVLSNWFLSVLTKSFEEKGRSAALEVYDDLIGSLHFIQIDYKKCLIFDIHISFIVRINDWVQLTKYARAEEFKVDPKGHKMFSRPNEFRKWLFISESTFKILIVLHQW